MTGPSDGTRLLLTALCAGWLVAFILAFVAHGPSADAGAEARSAFLGWQGVAGMFAVAIFGVSLQWPKATPVRRLAAVPLLLAGLVLLGIIGIFLWTNSG